MAYNFDISPLNPLKFYPLADKLPSYNVNDVINSFDANINTRPFDQDFFYQNIPSWQDKRWYAQPYQNGDTIRLQWLGISGVTVSNLVYLLDCNSNIVATYTPTNPTLTTINGLTIYECNIPLYNVAEGQYRVLILHRSSLINTPRYFAISEPIDVKKKHENTILIEYNNSKNAQGVIFEYGIKFTMRVHGTINDLTTESEFYVYEDEPLNMVMLSGIPYRIWKLQIGGDGNAIPQYMADKIERITLCDTMAIDTIYYTRDEGSKLEANKKDNVPLASYSLNLRERYNDNSMYLEQYQKPLVMNPTIVGAKYIYAHDMTYSTSSTLQIRKIFNGYDNLVEYLNSVVRLALSMKGVFAINVNNALVYIPATTAEVTSFANIVINEIYPYGIRYEIFSDGTQDFEVDYETIAGTINYAVSYDNGTTITKGSFSSSIQTFSNTYSSGYKVAYIIVDNADSLGNSLGNQVDILSIDGDCRSNLVGIIFNGCGLKSVGNLFRYTNSAFTILQLMNNKIISANIDKIIKNMYDSPRLKFTAFTADLSGQTPLAPPSDQIKDIIVPLLTKGGGTLTTD
jgi:hypothetical protein